MFDEIKGILRHSFFYGLANWLRPLLSLLVLPIVTEYLPLEDYGANRLLVQTTEFVGILIGMRFDLTVTRLYFDRKDEAERQRLVFSAFVWLLALSAIGAGLGALFSPELTTVIFKLSASGGADVDVATYAGYFRIAFLTLFFQLVAQVPSAYIRILKKSALFSAASIAGLILGLVLTIYFLAGMKLGLAGTLYSGLIVNAFLAVVLTGFMLRRVRPGISFRALRDLNSLSLPLLPGSLAVFALTFADQFIINYLRPNRGEVAIYGVAYKFGLLVSYVVTQPFMQFWRVRMYEIYQRGRSTKAYRKVLTLFAFVIVFAALGLSVFIDDVKMLLLGKPEYYPAAVLVPVLALAYVFAGIRYHVEVGIFLLKQPRFSSYVTVSAAALNIAANFALIPSLGPMGAAIATLVSFVYQVAASYYFSDRLFHVNYEVGRIVKVFAIGFALFALARVLTVDSAALSFFMHALVVMSFPIALYFVGFYTEDEKRKVKGLLDAFLRRGAGA